MSENDERRIEELRGALQAIATMDLHHWKRCSWPRFPRCAVHVAEAASRADQELATAEARRS